MPYRRVVGWAVSRALAWLSDRAGFVEDEVAGVPELVESGQVCLDIGAGFGLYTYVLAQRVGSGGQVHSLEPLPTPHRLLRQGARAAGLDNVRVHRAAAGAAPGTATMSVPRDNGWPVHGRAFVVDGTDGRGPNREFTDRRMLPVAVTTVDRLATAHRLEQVDFIKLDVEGAEPAVLDGAAATLARDRPDLLMEIEDRHLAKYGATAEELLRRLVSLGYHPHAWLDRRWTRVDRVTPSRRNYLFVHDRRARR